MVSLRRYIGQLAAELKCDRGFSPPSDISEGGFFVAGISYASLLSYNNIIPAFYRLQEERYEQF